MLPVASSTSHSRARPLDKLGVDGIEDFGPGRSSVRRSAFHARGLIPGRDETCRSLSLAEGEGTSTSAPRFESASSAMRTIAQDRE